MLWLRATLEQAGDVEEVEVFSEIDAEFNENAYYVDIQERLYVFSKIRNSAFLQVRFLFEEPQVLSMENIYCENFTIIVGGEERSVEKRDFFIQDGSLQIKDRQVRFLVSVNF